MSCSRISISCDCNRSKYRAAIHLNKCSSLSDRKCDLVFGKGYLNKWIERDRIECCKCHGELSHSVYQLVIPCHRHTLKAIWCVSRDLHALIFVLKVVLLVFCIQKHRLYLKGPGWLSSLRVPRIARQCDGDFLILKSLDWIVVCDH